MQTIDLAYVGRGIHEELVAHVADQEGYYEDEGVRDGVGWKIERLRRGATIGLGRALLSRLTDGTGRTVLTVNTDRPLFWFIGSADVTSMADLRGRRLAVHAADNPPAVSPGSSCVSTALTPTATWNVWCAIRVTTRWTCDAFGTARSTSPKRFHHLSALFWHGCKGEIVFRLRERIAIVVLMTRWTF